MVEGARLESVYRVKNSIESSNLSSSANSLITMFDKYLIYGLGKSGLATAKFLSDNGCLVFATDDNVSTIKQLTNIYPNIVFLNNIADFVFDSKTAVVFAPGIALYYPVKHKIIDLCQKFGSYLLGDIELFFLFNNSYNKFIGITGTNGKSTTVSLVAFAFDKLQIPYSVGGNLGVPCFNLPQQTKNHHYIFEVSSFQLDLTKQIRFHIASLLNITPDHLDRYGSLTNYIESKKHIFANQLFCDYAIINIDNKINANIIANWCFASKLLLVSNNEILQNGISLIDDVLFINFMGYNYRKEMQSEFLKGKHNQQNMVVAFANLFCYFLDKKQINEHIINDIIKSILQFSGLKHRLQIVAKQNNICFINDSKATNADSTSYALSAYDNIFWILGGRAKEGGINSLVSYFSKIKKAYLIGESANNFAMILQQNKINFVICNTLDNAFALAYQDAQQNQDIANILLSPACASLDQWQSFEHRGDYFCNLVANILK